MAHESLEVPGIVEINLAGEVALGGDEDIETAGLGEERVQLGDAAVKANVLLHEWLGGLGGRDKREGGEGGDECNWPFHDPPLERCL